MAADYEKLKSHLQAVAATAGAQFSALFVPSADGEALRLACSTQVDHGAIELADATWAGDRPTLLAGRAVRHARAVLWPLMDDGRFAALVYLNDAPRGMGVKRRRLCGVLPPSADPDSRRGSVAGLRHSVATTR